MKTDTRKPSARFMAFFCAIVVLFCAMATPIQAETAAEKYARLKKELADIGEDIEGVKGDKAAAEAARNSLANQKAVVDEMILLNQQEIADTEAALAAKEEEVSYKREEIYNNDLLFQQRLVAIYEMNNASVLSRVLSVDSFSELLQVMDAMQRISVNDTDLLALLATQRQELEVQQAEIDAMLVTLGDAYTELANNAAVLAGNIEAQNAAISAADAELAANEAAYAETSAALEQAQKEMEAIARSIQGSSRGDGSEYVGGVLTWPVPGFYRISCHFGSPDPNGAGHRGMDIAGGGIHGATVVAAGNGKVVTAAYAHSSYGNYIVIDHGNGIKTLYAHLSAISVGTGEVVSTGQGIGAVGSTGFSTGPHLHLEVHDGGLQNPLNYVRG